LRGIFLNLFTYTAKQFSCAEGEKDDFAEKLEDKNVITGKGHVSKISRNGKEMCCIHCSEKEEHDK